MTAAYLAQLKAQTDAPAPRHAPAHTSHAFAPQRAVAGLKTRKKKA